jgi:hypothetical protein
MTPTFLLPASELPRALIHQRRIELHSFRRSDGLWDLEAVLQDTRTEALAVSGRRYDAGMPIHLMAVRLTVGNELVVRQATAGFGRVPFPGNCEGVTAGFSQLIGANLMHGFRQRVAEVFPRHERCTHVSELLLHLPTLAAQTILAVQTEDTGQRPIKVGACRAWRDDGPLVREYHPKWYRKPDPSHGEDGHRSDGGVQPDLTA